MEKRLVLAIGLMLVVAVVPSLLLRRGSRPAPIVTDSATIVADQTRQSAPDLEPTRAPIELPTPPSVGPPSGESAAVQADTVIVESNLYRYGITTDGGRIISAVLKDYQAFQPSPSGSVELVRDADAFLDQRLVVGMDTLALSALEFEASTSRLEVAAQGSELILEARQGRLSVVLRYEFRPDRYRFAVRGQITGLSAAGAQLMIGLSDGLKSQEADTADDFRNHSIVTRARKTESLRFDRVSPFESRALPGPFDWAATKSKYFVAALLAIDEGAVPLSGLVVRGGPRIDKIATHLTAAAVLPIPQTGGFAYDVYLGPQEASYLRAIGHDFSNVNPYGWILRPVIMPIASVVVSVLVWMHETLSLSYGWVLILFGLGVRLILWPLNQKAMESNMRMQAAQPYMKEVQEKYKGDNEKLQKEMMKVYKEHGVNPLGGCLPMLIPMPVLFALFFVFANTIEFRGVPFLWLPDLSRGDPLYIVPVVMGISMFALMKLGQRGVPPNPQTKIMVYFMPAFMTIILLRFAAGLNLYYAAQNVFSLPQQWLISKKRLARAASSGTKG